MSRPVHHLTCTPDCSTCRGLRRATLEAVAEGGVRDFTLKRLSETAGVALHGAAVHGGDARSWLEAAYLESAALLQDTFDEDFGTDTTWRDGLQRAAEGLVGTLSADPARARFSYVEVLEGDASLRLLREQVRERSVRLFTHQYVARHADGAMRALGIEVVCNSLIHAIATHAREGRMAELPGRLDAVLAVADAGDPPRPMLAAVPSP